VELDPEVLQEIAERAARISSRARSINARLTQVNAKVEALALKASVRRDNLEHLLDVRDSKVDPLKVRV